MQRWLWDVSNSYPTASAISQREGEIMHSAPYKYRLALFTSLLLLATAILNKSPADANVKSTRNSDLTVSTSAWGAYLVPAGTTPSPGPYVTSWIAAPGTQLAYLDLLNPNALALSGENFILNSVEPNSSRQNVPRITFDLCVGAAWNQNANTCAGSITSLGTSTGGTVNSTVAVPGQSRLSVRLTVTKVGKLSWTTTINTVITRVQVRAATSSNS